MTKTETKSASATESKPAGKSATKTVAEKSDVKDKEDDVFRKQFVIQGLRIDSDRSAEDNLNSVLEDARFQAGCFQQTAREALYRGLHPKGEVKLEDAEIISRSLNSVTYKATYAVTCVPASVDEDPESTVFGPTVEPGPESDPAQA